MIRNELLALADQSGLGRLDLSLGVSADPPPEPPLQAETPGQGYPPSAGTVPLRSAAAGMLRRRYGVDLPHDSVAACAGAKEFICSLPLFLRAAGAVAEGRDTVLIPGLCYPAYANGARLAGFSVHRVPLDDDNRMRLDKVPGSVAHRAVCLWVNSPSNPTGVVEPLEPVADWCRRRRILVLSDEAYADLTWSGPPRTILAAGTDGVLAVHSLSKGYNAPGLRVGIYAGDQDLVARLVAERRAAGLMASAGAQAFAARLLSADEYVNVQRARQERRLTGLVKEIAAVGIALPSPAGGMFVWAPAPGGDGTAFARDLATHAGLVVMPGSEYGSAGHGHVRIAAVHEPDRIAERLALCLDRVHRIER
jgi:acetylornithine/N-succinyldiaminopimelate aminotransferase